MQTLYLPPEKEIEGWMGLAELQWLYDQALKMNHVIEVGSWKGRSTHALCSGCRGTVVSVDHFCGSPSELRTHHKEALEKDIYAEFCANMREFLNLCVYKQSSHIAAGLFSPRSVDMVFIDGEHTLGAARTDLRCWAPVAKKLLCGHDWNEIPVKQAVKELGLPVELGPGLLWSVKVG